MFTRGQSQVHGSRPFVADRVPLLSEWAGTQMVSEITRAPLRGGSDAQTIGFSLSLGPAQYGWLPERSA